MDHATAESATAWATIATAIAGWGMAFVTIWMVRAQLAEAKRATGLQLFTQLARDFQDPAMRRLRHAFASKLIMARMGDRSVKPLEDETVLEFFENLAHLTRNRVLDRQIVWNYFSVAVEGYWHASKDSVLTARSTEGDSDLYTDLEWLSNELSAIDAERCGQRVAQAPAHERVNNYLRSEQTLS